MSGHEIAPWAAWHGRMMVAAWVVLLPLGILVARFFKVTRRQRWPERLDNKLWWHLHLTLQYSGIAIMTVAALLAARNSTLATPTAQLHAAFGWTVVALGWLQIAGGLLRGSKGGPQTAGDHYDMTPRRVVFEYMHKSAGYVAVVFAVIAIYLGLLTANAPRWMGWTLGMISIAGLAIFVWLQRQGRCIDTYQAIWGPGLEHPGNRRRPIGLGIRRYQDRSDRPRKFGS